MVHGIVSTFIKTSLSLWLAQGYVSVQAEKQKHYVFYFQGKKKQVIYFRGESSSLSNFHSCALVSENIEYNSAEQFTEAERLDIMKVRKERERERERVLCKQAVYIKRLAWFIDTTCKWEDDKMKVITKIITVKFDQCFCF